VTLSKSRRMVTSYVSCYVTWDPVAEPPDAVT
jgi:hypothetical protein